ncbi:ARHGB factor, partial [Haliaeetus albicilla]|nr:ARHGB factor [Haliaeetus albicilla]
ISPLCIHPKLQDPEVQKHATQILRNMLRQEEAELQRFYEAYSRNPATAVEEQIEGARRRVSQLQLKILQETGGFMVREISGVTPRSGVLPSSQLLPSMAGAWGDPPKAVGTAAETSLSVPSSWQGLDRTGQPLIIGPEEDYDPGYFNNECDSLFQDLGKLKSRPAHLGVFLRYIFSQADPSPLLFYLCTDVCQQTTAKDSRGLGKDIWNIFLDRNAVRAGLDCEPVQDSLSLQGISWK